MFENKTLRLCCPFLAGKRRSVNVSITPTSSYIKWVTKINFLCAAGGTTFWQEDIALGFKCRPNFNGIVSCRH
jgi:hypothetical protein